MSDHLWQILGTIERSILPRTLKFESASDRFEIDALGGRLLLAPRLNGAFIADDHLKQDQLSVWEVLRRGVLASEKDCRILHGGREALKRQCARVLATILDRAPGPLSIQALKSIRLRVDATQLPNASIYEILGELMMLLTASAKGVAADFFQHVAPMCGEGWLIDSLCRPLAFPAEATSADQFKRAVQAAADSRIWRDEIGIPGDQLMVVLFSAAGDKIHSVAIDKDHIAFVTGSASDLGTILAHWRAAERSQGAQSQDLPIPGAIG